MIEGVEGLEAELQRSCIGEAKTFLEGHVEVANAGTVEVAAFGVAELAELLFRKEGGVEGWAAVAAIGVDVERAGEILRRVEEIVVGSVAEGAEEGVVGVIEEGDGKAGGEAGDAGEAPLFGEAIAFVQESRYGERPVVAGDEVVFEIPGGDGAALSGIDGVELLAEAGALVDGFGVGVTEEELRAVALVAEGGFEGVVVGGGDGLIGGVFTIVGALTYASSLHCLSGAIGVGGVFAEGAAALEALAECRVAGVCGDERKDAVALIADVADCEQSVAGELTLEGEHVVVGVGCAVAVVEEGVRCDGSEVGPVD